jgi:hypothetical protein
MKRFFILFFGLVLAAHTARGQFFITTNMIPLEITEPGYYVVTAPLSHGIGTPGIHVRTNNVTIDLNGYTFTGPDIGSSSGILQDAGSRNLVVKNGALTEWGKTVSQAAIRALGSNNRFESLMIYNVGNGLSSGANTLVDRVTVTQVDGPDTQHGINIGATGRVRDCLVGGVSGGNTAIAIQAGNNSMVENCVVRNVLGTTASYGISISSGHVRDSVVHNLSGGTVAAGILGGDGIHVEGCVIHQVLSPGTSAGVVSVSPYRSRVYHSSVMRVGNALTAGAGVLLGSGTVAENAIYGGGNSAVIVSGNSLVLNNVSTFNLAGGVRFEGSRNKVEGNLFSSGAVAVDFGGWVDNLILRNADFDNTLAIGGIGNHVAEVLSAPGADFTHPTRPLYFENISW